MLHLLALAAIFAQFGQLATTSLEGRWRNPSGSVIIAIAQCGERQCGTVEWASDKAIADALKGGNDPLVGTQVLTDIKEKGLGRWSARLFVPDLNKRSNAQLRAVGDDRLKVIGCAIGGLVCKSQTWTRI